MFRSRALAPILLSLPLATGLIACRPSASVTRTTPVANLQSYQTALVRVAGAGNTQQLVPVLEFATSDRMRQRCSFARVVAPAELGDIKPDLILDLNIRGTRRGGGGFIKNPNLATVNVSMVLSDGIDDDLLGSADIEGKSSAVAVQGADPENEAILAVADRITKILAKSGCSGERVARAEPAPPPTTTPTDTNTTTVSPETLAQAEAANDEGKRLFRGSDFAAAKGQFEQALTLSPDPRFSFNLCLANEALADLDGADKACRDVLAANPEQRLADKANQRLAIIADKRGG